MEVFDQYAVNEESESDTEVRELRSRSRIITPRLVIGSMAVALGLYFLSPSIEVPSPEKPNAASALDKAELMKGLNTAYGQLNSSALLGLATQSVEGNTNVFMIAGEPSIMEGQGPIGVDTRIISNVPATSHNLAMNYDVELYSPTPQSSPGSDNQVPTDSYIKVSASLGLNPNTPPPSGGAGELTAFGSENSTLVEKSETDTPFYSFSFIKTASNTWNIDVSYLTSKQQNVKMHFTTSSTPTADSVSSHPQEVGQIIGQAEEMINLAAMQSPLAGTSEEIV